MFRVEFAPDTVCQLERLVLRQLESGGRAGAYDFLNEFEACIAALRNNPVFDAVHIDGIPKRYWAKQVFSEILLIYQIDEESACVRVDGMIDDRTEIS